MDDYEILSPEERAQQEIFEENTNEDGEFKSLGHYYRVYPDELPPLQDGDRDPFQYSPYQQEQWEQDLNLSRQKRASVESVKEGVLEAERVRQEPDYSILDDPHRIERMELMGKIREFELKGEAARQRGETRPGYTAHDYVQRAKQYYEAVQKLPPPVEVQVAQQRVAAIDEAAVNRLYDPKEKDNPIFKKQRLGMMRR